MAPLTRRERLALVAVVLVAAAAALVVHRWWFPLLSGDNDEPVYLTQADLARHGRFTLPLGDYLDTFRPWLSGPHDGRIVFPFNAPYPTFLAVVRSVLGSFEAGLALVGGGLALSGFALFRRLLPSNRSALVATGLFALSPLAVTQSALFLSYGFTTVLGLATLAVLLRGVEEDRWGWTALAGLGWGLTFATRPYDAALYAVAGVLIVLARNGLGPVPRTAGRFLVGAALPVIGALAFNVAVTGSPTHFPVDVAGGENALLFGERSVGPGAGVVSYHLDDALSALADNLTALPTWLLGSWVLVAVGVVGVVLRRRAAIPFLALGGTFAIGYFFWWASGLASIGARDGIGPHYHLPTAAALVGLAVLGGLALLERRDRIPAPTVLAAAGVALGLVITAAYLPSKIDDKTRQTDRFRQWQDALDALPDDEDLLVVVADDAPGYLGSDVPWGNGSDLDGARVVYANDTGVQVLDIAEREGRQPYVLRPLRHPEDDLFVPSVVAQPLAVVEGACLRITATTTAPQPAATFEQTLATGDGQPESTVVDDDGVEFAEQHAIEAVVGDGPGAPSLDPAQDTFTVGLHYRGEDDAPVSDYELRFRYRADEDGTLEVVTPPGTWHRFEFGERPWLQEDLTGVVDDIEVQPC